MNRAMPEERTLLERVEHLERKSHWLTALAMVLGLLCVSLLAWQFAPIEPIIEARGFVLRDPRWRMLAELKARQDGTPVLRLYGDTGRPSALLHVDASGSVALRLNDPLGRRRAELSVDREGSPALVLSDADGYRRAVLAVDETGETRGQGMALRDPTGRVVWSTPAATPAP